MNATFRGAILNGTDFTGVNVAGVDFTGAQGLNLRGSTGTPAFMPDGSTPAPEPKSPQASGDQPNQPSASANNGRPNNGLPEGVSLPSAQGLNDPIKGDPVAARANNAPVPPSKGFITKISDEAPNNRFDTPTRNIKIKEPQPIDSTRSRQPASGKPGQELGDVPPEKLERLYPAKDQDGNGKNGPGGSFTKARNNSAPTPPSKETAYNPQPFSMEHLPPIEPISPEVTRSLLQPQRTYPSVSETSANIRAKIDAQFEAARSGNVGNTPLQATAPTQSASNLPTLDMSLATQQFQGAVNAIATPVTAPVSRPPSLAVDREARTAAWVRAREATEKREQAVRHAELSAIRSPLNIDVSPGLQVLGGIGRAAVVAGEAVVTSPVVVKTGEVIGAVVETGGKLNKLLNLTP